jgi:hypothetical protein
MKNLRSRAVLVAAALLAASTLASSPAASNGSGGKHRHPHHDPPTSTESAQVVLDWQRTAIATVYPVTPIPTGIPVLGFTSLAINDAVTTSLSWGSSSETAAVAWAAHDVLLHYYPGSGAALDAQLATSLAGVPDGPDEDRGARAGERAAARMIASRYGDGYGDTTIHYTLPPGIGVWQPVPPATDMLGAWLGSVRPLVIRHPVRFDGPDRLTSADYTTDYNEVKLLGSTASAVRSQTQADTAVFFNTNPAVMQGDALIRNLESHPQDLQKTAWLFAALHGAMADSVIRCWQLKRDVGYWRPFQAVAAAADDGNPDTQPESGWTSYLPTPPYSDYVSGHGCLTASAVEVIRTVLGEDTQLELRSSSLAGAVRTYPTLTALEYDALNSRIWGGLHFRDAMSDGYSIGHQTARMVMKKLG